MEQRLSELLQVAQSAAEKAGEYLQHEWLNPRELQHKGFRDWVTDADFASQRLITTYIAEQFPEHGFRTEEDSPDLPQTGDVIWVIDPIDGTSNFSRQQPNFCTSIAAVAAGESLVAAVYDPIRNELFSAAQGQGAYLNERRLESSHITALEEAIVALDWAHSPEKRQESLDMLGRFAHHVHSMRAIGSAVLALSWVAAGRLDAYLNLSLKPWDVSAGALLIREAGGRVTDLQNRPWSPTQATVSCLGSNRFLHEPLLALVQE